MLHGAHFCYREPSLSFMSADPPPVPSSRRKFLLELARASWMSVIIAFGINIALSAAGQSEWTRTISAVVGGSLALTGLVAGIVALCGVRRHGRQGLLWPAITGVCLWLLLFGLAVP